MRQQQSDPFADTTADGLTAQKPAPRGIKVGALLALMVIAGTGAWWHDRHKHQVFRQIEAQLSAIVQLKANAIAAWHEDQLEDAAVIAAKPELVRWVERRTATGDIDPQPLPSLLRQIQAEHKYTQVLMVSRSGRHQAAANTDGTLTAKHAQPLMRQIDDRRAVTSYVDLGSWEAAPHLFAAAPVCPADHAGSCPSVLILINDILDDLQPILETWPLPSASGETMLLEQRTEGVEILNPLRHRHRPKHKGAISAPSYAMEDPLVQAMTGRQDLIRGTDHRGTEILATARAIPNTPWHLLVMVDRDEALVDWRTQSRLFLGLLSGIALAIVAAATLLLLRRQTGYYRHLYKDEAERRRRLSLFHTVVESAPEAIVLADHDGLIFANTAAVRLFGAETKTQLQGHRLLDYLHPDERDTVTQHLDHLLLGRRPTVGQIEVTLIRHDGAIRRARTSAVPFTYGGKAAALIFMQDLTEQHQLALQLQQSQKLEAVGRLAGGVAHDFNNLIMVIAGFATELKQELPPQSPQISALDEIIYASDQAKDLTRQLLAVGRKQVLKPEMLDLNHVVTRMEKLLRRVIGADIDLVTRLRPHLQTVKLDPSQIEQIIVNLAVNARDAMPSGGKLTIETANVELDEDYAAHHPDARIGPHVLLAVTDTGTGMTEEERNRIFEPFFTTKDQDKGTGLGLSTVHGIVKQSGGNIWVYSEPGHGATFKIYLPAQPGTTAVPRTAPPSQTQPQKAAEATTILVVDDDDAVRRLLVTVLKRAGYRVLDADGGESAIGICKQAAGAIDLLMTDVVMPGMDGRDVAAAVTEHVPDIHVIYMSGYTGGAIAHQGILDQDTTFIEKPISSKALLQKIAEVLGIPD